MTVRIWRKRREKEYERTVHKDKSKFDIWGSMKYKDVRKK